jgi:MYXO-CTERM domain-containing protein
MFTIMASGTTLALGTIVNGSFENGTAYPAAPDNLLPGTPSPWGPIPSGFTPDMYDNSAIDGFDLSGVPAYDNMFDGMVAYDGSRFIGFAASPAFGGFKEAFRQTSAALTGGLTYTLSAQLATDDRGNASPGFGGPYSGLGEVKVFLNSGYIGTLTQNSVSMTWQTRSFTFIAPTASSAVWEFEVQVDPSTGGASYVGLDHIRCAVPEPGMLGFFGLAGLALVRRRRPC